MVVTHPRPTTRPAPPTVPQATPEERAKTLAAMIEAPPDFTLKAREFFDEYQFNKSSAQKKYQDKVVELDGTVDSMGQDWTRNQSFIHLFISDKVAGVRCVTIDPEPWATVVPGQTVKIKGRWPAGIATATATLTDCVFVDTGTSPAITLSAEQLAKEYAADRKAVRKKYDGKYLVVDGEIVRREQISKRGASTISLKGDGSVRVACFFTAAEGVHFDSLKVGQQARVIGKFVMPEESNDPALSFCLLITGRKEGKEGP
jgi:hypothetical protein